MATPTPSPTSPPPPQLLTSSSPYAPPTGLKTSTTPGGGTGYTDTAGNMYVQKSPGQYSLMPATPNPVSPVAPTTAPTPSTPQPSPTPAQPAPSAPTPSPSPTPSPTPSQPSGDYYSLVTGKDSTGNPTYTYYDSNAQQVQAPPQGANVTQLTGNFTPDQEIKNDQATQSQNNPNGLPSALTAEQQQLNDLGAKNDQAYSQFQSAYNAIANGTFPLTQWQQSLLDSTKAQFDQLANAQKIANETYQSGLATFEARSGEGAGGSTTAMGNLANAVTQGQQKIAELEAKGSQALAQLEQGFQSDNLKMITAAYDEWNKYSAEKSKTITALYDQTTQAVKDMRDFIMNNVTKPINDLSVKAKENGAPQSIVDAIQGSKTYGEAIIASGDYLRSDPNLALFSSWATDAAKNAQTPEAQKAIAQALTMSLTDPSRALQMLSPYMSDPIAQAQALLNIQKTQAEIAKTKVDTATAQANLQGSQDIVPGTPQYKVAQDLAYGNLTMQQFRTLYSYSRNINQKLSIYQLASQLNPNFSPAAFELGYTFASNPKVRQQVTSLDNVMNVTPNVIAASDAAIRSGTGLNGWIIKGGIAIGNSNYSNMDLARTAFADELSGALGYGSATDMSREMGFDLTNPSLSAQQFKDGMTQIVAPFIASKRGVLVNAMGIYGQTINSQSSGAAGQGTGMVKLKDPNTGEVRSFSQMSPADFQEAITKGYTVVTQ